MCVCLSVKSHLTYGASVRPENAVTYSAGNEGQKICGVFSENAPLLRSSGAAVVFHTFIWVAIFLHSKSGAHAYWYSQLCLQSRREIPSLPNDCQQHSALPKTMPPALVTRTDSTTRYCYNARRSQFQRTRIGIVHKTRHNACSSNMRRGFCTLVLFMLIGRGRKVEISIV